MKPNETALQGRVALVTGAGRGLGQSIAAALGARGAVVALVARSQPQLLETEMLIRNGGGIAGAFPTDLRTAQTVSHLKDEVLQRFGPPSILVNAAGVFGPIQMIADSDAERWIETLMINTVAPYLTCRAFVGDMVEAGWGRVINLSSAAAFHAPGPLSSAYATSKVALNQFTRHLASELTGTGVTANVFHPGDVKTEMWATIAAEAAQLGDAGAGYKQWVDWVAETGGDPPQKAADLVVKLVTNDAAAPNGAFLWIDEPLQPPLPTWPDPAAEEPWKQ